MGFSASSARGREESAARTRGRRKVIAERIEYDEPDRSNVRTLPGSVLPPYVTVRARLIGSCGHTLLALAAVPVRDGEPQPAPYLTRKLGHRMTCQHDDCKIPEKPAREPRPDDCTWTIHTSSDLEDKGRRCRTRAKWNTDMGALCTRHRDYLQREGYLDTPGTEIERGERAE